MRWGQPLLVCRRASARRLGQDIGLSDGRLTVIGWLANACGISRLNVIIRYPEMVTVITDSVVLAGFAQDASPGRQTEIMEVVRLGIRAAAPLLVPLGSL